MAQRALPERLAASRKRLDPPNEGPPKPAAAKGAAPPVPQPPRRWRAIVLIAGIAAAAYLYLVNPALPGVIATRFRALYTLLDNKYYLDRFNDWFFAGGARVVGRFASVVGDRTIIDGLLVNGSAKLVAFASREFRRIQSGYVYHYAFVMIVGVFVLLYWWGVR